MKAAVSLGLLAVVLSQVAWRETLQLIRASQRSYLAGAGILALLGIGVRAYRWKILLDALGASVSLPRLINLYFVGTFFSNFLPSGVGGDVVRAYEVKEDTGGLTTATASVVVDRATGLLALFAMGCGALLLRPELVSGALAALLWSLTAVCWGACLLFLVPPRYDWQWFAGMMEKVPAIGRMRNAMRVFGSQALVKALGASVSLNVVLIIMNYWVGRALGITISFWYYVLFVPIVSFLLILPFSLSGWGVREGGYVFLFSQAGVSATSALTLSLLVQSLQLALGLIGAVLYASKGVRGLRQADEQPR